MTDFAAPASRIFNGCLLCIAVWWGGWADSIVHAASPSETRSFVPLFDNLGTLHHSITTSSSLAQRYFDQGLRLVYAFNHEEAVLAFKEAAAIDPSAAMAYWGIALALGPNINAAMNKPRERRALEALHQAQARSAHASIAERRYIDALGKRYAAKGRTRATLDKAYADAMRLVWREFPEDPNTGVLFAEALMDLRPWDLWTSKGQPRPGTEEIVSTLEAILARHPDHPGACHYYIHAVEASPTPERALSCAERLPTLMPGAGHLMHMPAHIYMRVGKYHQAAEWNAQAVHVDRGYLSARKVAQEYAGGYYPHNLHFLWAALAMEGRRDESLKVARELAHMISEEDARKDKGKEAYLLVPLWSMIRFGQGHELLREPPPRKHLRLHQGIWRLGRGMALAGTGHLPGAEGEHTVLAGLAKRLGRDRTPEEKTERALLKIAERLLAGELAARHRRYDEAITCFKDAVKLEDGLPYMEPPFWSVPVRHYLGDILLIAGQPADAEAIYRADLAKNADNGWALFGLMRSLRDQGKSSEADTIEQQFKAAWTNAEVTLTASRF